MLYLIYILIFYLTSYLIGSISSGVIISKIFCGVDIRNYGSKSSGATNVYRICGFIPALITFIADFLKGFFIYYFLVRVFLLYTSLDYVVLSWGGVFVTLGHIFPCFAKNFKGGKGVATALGYSIASQPLISMIAILVWLMVFHTYRIVSLASLLATISFFFLISFNLYFYKYNIHYFLSNFVLISIVIAAHFSNIYRLLFREEYKFKKENY